MESHLRYHGVSLKDTLSILNTNFTRPSVGNRTPSVENLRYDNLLAEGKNHFLREEASRQLGVSPEALTVSANRLRKKTTTGNSISWVLFDPKA